MLVHFRRVSGAEVLTQSVFEIPLTRPRPGLGVWGLFGAGWT